MSLVASGYHAFLNQEILVVMRQSVATGTLSTYDQFGTLILEDAILFKSTNNELKTQKTPVFMIRGECAVAFGPVKSSFQTSEKDIKHLLTIIKRRPQHLAHLGFCLVE